MYDYVPLSDDITSFVLLNIKILKNGGILTPEDLPALCEAVEEVAEETGYDNIYIVSGRMPMWAGAAITHTLHPAMASAMYEPRSNSAIIVQSHTPEYSIGDVIPLDGIEYVEIEITYE